MPRREYSIPSPISSDENGDIPILIEETIFDNNNNSNNGSGNDKQIDPGIHRIVDPDSESSVVVNNDNIIDPTNPKYQDTELWVDNPNTKVFNMDNLVSVQIGSFSNKGLLKNLCVPSASHAYSVAVEFFKNWVLSKFDKNYFKTVYIDGKHLFDEFAKINEKELVKRGKPAIAIIPSLDINFNREGIDVTQHDLNYYARTFNHRETFFKDLSKDLYIGVSLDQLLFNFQVKVKLNTRAKQLDVMRYMKIAYKIGATSGYYMDMDMHVPYDMLFTLAEEVGFDVDYDNKLIKEPFKFLSYLNSHSEIPFIYKLRSINNRPEFFLRASNMYVHIKVPDINIDDGERQNQVSSNYYIEFSAEMRFPAPKIFCYFSMKTSNFMRFNENGQLKTYIINFSNIPNTNSKGWDQFISLSYEEEDKSKPLTIEFGDIFAKDINIMRVIKACKDCHISPSAFLDFKVFNNNEEYLYDIDWDTLSLTTREPVEHILSSFIVYLNKEFFNDSLVTLDNAYKKRIKDTKVTNNNSNIDPFE